MKAKKIWKQLGVICFICTLASCSKTNVSNHEPPREDVTSHLPGEDNNTPTDEKSEGQENGDSGDWNKDDKTKLTWMLPYGVPKGDSKVYEEFNLLLSQKGYNFYVDFDTTGRDMDTYVGLLYEARDTGKQLDLYNTGYDYYGGLYGDLIADGMCYCLDELMASETGQKLYTSKDADVWTSLSKDGSVYGVAGKNTVAHTKKYYLYLNQELAVKYGADGDRMAADSAYFWSVLEQVTEKEAEKEGFLTLIRLDGRLYQVMSDVERLFGPVALTKSADGIKAVNLYELPEVKDSMIHCNRMYEQNLLLQEAKEPVIEAGNYFAILSEAEMTVPNADCFETPWMAVNQSGSINCIAPWSENKEESFELLCAIQTDKELSELLAYGMGGRGSYYSSMFLCNAALLQEPDYDVYTDAGLSQKDREELYYSSLFGKRFDLREIRNLLMQVSQTESVCFPSYLENSSWREQDFEQMYANGLTALDEAGLEELLAQINAQLKEMGLQ